MTEPETLLRLRVVGYARHTVGKPFLSFSLRPGVSAIPMRRVLSVDCPKTNGLALVPDEWKSRVGSVVCTARGETSDDDTVVIYCEDNIMDFPAMAPSSP